MNCLKVTPNELVYLFFEVKEVNPSLALQPRLAPARDLGTESEVRLDTRREGGVTDILTPTTPLSSRDSRAASESLMVQVTLGMGWPAERK